MAKALWRFCQPCKKSLLPDEGGVCSECGVLTGHTVCMNCGVIRSNLDHVNLCPDFCQALPAGQVKHTGPCEEGCPCFPPPGPPIEQDTCANPVWVKVEAPGATIKWMCMSCLSLFVVKVSHQPPDALVDPRPTQDCLFSERDMAGRFRWRVEWRWKAEVLVQLYPHPPRPDGWFHHTQSGQLIDAQSAENAARKLRKNFPGKSFRVVPHI